MASKTKIYIVLEFVTGGELFDKIVRMLLLQVFLLVTITIRPLDKRANNLLILKPGY